MEFLGYVRQAQELGITQQVLEWSEAADMQTVELLMRFRMASDKLLSEKRERDIEQK